MEKDRAEVMVAEVSEVPDSKADINGSLQGVLHHYLILLLSLLRPYYVKF